jgi:hypothetical protein
MNRCVFTIVSAPGVPQEQSDVGAGGAVKAKLKALLDQAPRVGKTREFFMLNEKLGGLAKVA